MSFLCRQGGDVVNQKFFTDVKLKNIRNFLTERRGGQIEFFKD